MWAAWAPLTAKSRRMTRATSWPNGSLARSAKPDDGTALASGERPIEAGDVMVLVRRRDALVEALARAFKRQGIPVAGVDRMILTDQLAVMDLIKLGEFLLLPEDDLTLATVLKSPLIGLDEADLFELAHDRGGAALWRALRRRAHERPGWARADAQLLAWLDRADRTPPHDYSR